MRQGLLAFGFNGLTLAVNLVTGILVARALGASGRGELTAIVAAPQLIGWVLALGCSQAVAVHQAKKPEQGAKLFGTWIAVGLALGVLAVIAGEALLPTILSAQTDATLRIARLYMLAAFLMPAGDLVNGMLLGDQDFFVFNLLRFAQPAAMVLVYAVLWAFGGLSVGAAVGTTFAVGISAMAVAGWRTVRRHGIAAPDKAIARTTLWYAVRAHGGNVGGLVNARLDLLIIPAFLSAASVGLYSVATSVSWIVVSLAGALAAIVGPAAARRGGEAGSQTVVRAMHATIVVSLAVAIFVAVVARGLVPLLYGGEFSASVRPLLLLLPGSVLYAAASILWSGLYSVERPFGPALAQAAGVVVTVAGLLLFLRQGGITVAALVSTVAYALVFVVSISLYNRVVRLPLRAYLPSVDDVSSLAHAAVVSVRTRHRS
jgi:O-antigen/teichoic acid export membrane protein